MRVIGKIVGAIVGFILFRSPYGILIGALLGHFYDTAAHQLRPPSMGRGFIEPLFAFAGALSKSDGRVSEPEIVAAEALMARLRLDDAQRRAAIERFNAGKASGFDAAPAIDELKAWCAGRRDFAFIVLDLLLDLVYAEGSLAQAKLTLLRQLCRALGISDQELAWLATMKGYASATPRPRGPGYGPRPPPAASRPSEIDPYAVLGIARGATEIDIRRAYRKQMSQHHPDKLGDVPEELKHRAGERAREINAAYERIKGERGIR